MIVAWECALQSKVRAAQTAAGIADTIRAPFDLSESKRFPDADRI